jgi:hypothetical protein
LEDPTTGDPNTKYIVMVAILDHIGNLSLNHTNCAKIISGLFHCHAAEEVRRLLPGKDEPDKVLAGEKKKDFDVMMEILECSRNNADEAGAEECFLDGTYLSIDGLAFAFYL